jgi:hypothetical protein
MTTATKALTIGEAQEELQKLDTEEASLPALRQAKQVELDEARWVGDSHRAVLLVEDLAYLNGPKLEHIWRARLEAQVCLKDAVLVALEQEIEQLMAPVPEQLQKEIEVRKALEEVSGCQWQPKIDAGESMGRTYHAAQMPLSERWQREIDYRLVLAKRF